MPSISDLVTFNLVSLVGKRFNFDWNKCTTGWSSIQPSASYFAETFNKQPQSPSNRWKTSNISKMSTSCLFAFTFLSLSLSLSLSLFLSLYFERKLEWVHTENTFLQKNSFSFNSLIAELLEIVEKSLCWHI